METDHFEVLETIISGNPLPPQTPKLPLYLAVQAIVKKIPSTLEESASAFIHYLSESKNQFLQPDTLLENINDIQFIAGKHSKLYNFDKESRGYVICGKAVSAYKRSKKTIEQTTEDKDTRQQFTNLIQHGIARLFYDGKYALSKWEKNYNLDDILLQHEMPDPLIQEVYLSNMVFSPFVPIEKTVVMVVPSKSYKYECTSFVRSSLLHIYLDESPLLSKVMSKELFYKNSILKGIYFVEEGEVQVKSGRIIARGWTTNGVCKTSGHGWKFRPVPFMRFVGKYKVWKQFLNDLKLNQEYPFNIINILGINEDQDFTSTPEWRSLGKKKLGAKSTKLPRLINRSVDEEKFLEIEKMRHYDDRLDGLFSYKQDLLMRKMKGNLYKDFEPIYKMDKQTEKSLEKKRMLSRINSKRSHQISKETIHDLQPSENILILSVLKRLQSLADTEIEKKKIGKEKKSNFKITPMQLYEKNRKVKRHGRYAL